MIDITSKKNTLRKAYAMATLLCDKFILDRIAKNDLPKGEPFEVARAAGFLAAKNTANLIPHCHPVAIDHLNIDFKIIEKGIEINTYVQSIGKTGIEMEALMATSITSLTLYDLLKPLKGNIEITGLKLLKKTGGDSASRKKHVKKGVTAAVLVCSDGTAAGTRPDKSGKIIKEMLENFEVEIRHYDIVPDEPEMIKEKILTWVDENINFIFTTGGTGLGPRDNTAKTVRPLLEKEAPGITEAMRAFGQNRTPVAMLSGSCSGLIKKTLVILLPGSSNGARESLNAILPDVFHALPMILGGGHE